VPTLRSILFTFFLLLLAIGAWVYFFCYSPIQDPQGARYIIHEGKSFQSVTEDLANQNIIHSSHLFNLLIRWHGYDHKLKAGEYLFPKGATPFRILQQIVTGTGLVQHPFTIIAGWNFKQVREALEKESLLQHTITNLTDQQIMTQLGQPNLNPEGEFFPDTYFFTADSADIKLLKRSFKAMQVKLNNAWQNRMSGLPYATPYQALIVASLIEKEAHFDIERPIISGVILNRLNKKMLLQIDASVIYGLGSRYDGTLYKKNLKENTPYNTYLRAGLPPTPIAMPGLSSIQAAMQPAIHDYIYYVARGDGYHQFSKSFNDHSKAIETVKKLQTSFYNSKLIKKHMFNALSFSVRRTTTATLVKQEIS
jgi:UPF0755 protein